MLSIVHLTAPSPAADLREQGGAALSVLSQRSGFVRGSLGRATDDPDSWVLATEWESVGSYRRALGHVDVKMIATPLFYLADDAPSGFEQLVTAVPGAPLSESTTDLATGTA